MAPALFHLITLKASINEGMFLDAVRSLPASDRPVYLGQTRHWIHSPHLSTEALTGRGDMMQRWDYLMVNKAVTPKQLAIPDALSSLVDQQWSISKDVPDEQLDEYQQAKQKRDGATVPPLPAGWSPKDHTGIDAAEPPADLEASLALSSYRLGATKDMSNKPVLKAWTVDFGSHHTGIIHMFNLLSYMPEGIPRYMKYVAAFTESVGSKYGGDPVFIGFDGECNWSSKQKEGNEVGVGWEHVALIQYPSIWHFAKMLDDPSYMEVDRKFKSGALRDNPLICCTEIDL